MPDSMLEEKILVLDSVMQDAILEEDLLLVVRVRVIPDCILEERLLLLIHVVPEDMQEE